MKKIIRGSVSADFYCEHAVNFIEFLNFYVKNELKKDFNCLIYKKDKNMRKKKRIAKRFCLF
jgi:hypothetical protein